MQHESSGVDGRSDGELAIQRPPPRGFFVACTTERLMWMKRSWMGDAFTGIKSSSAYSRSNLRCSVSHSFPTECDQAVKGTALNY
ncbi:unnamed protein product [Boreogadus saida]